METNNQPDETESRFLYFEPRFNLAWAKIPLKKHTCYVGLGGSGGRILDSARVITNIKKKQSDILWRCRSLALFCGWRQGKASDSKL